MMACHVDTAVVSSARTFRTHKTSMWIGALVLLLAAGYPVARAQAVQEKSGSKSCANVPQLDFGDANDVQSLQANGAILRQLLKDQKFQQLDCIADAERSDKERLPGGMWKIHEFYWALTQLQGHPTPEDWRNYIKLVQSWTTARPHSITARVMLAKAYVKYAWDARGNDTSDTVTESGWKLFGQRLEKAKAILEEASTLPSKCPEWYLAMQDISLGQGWDQTKVADLLKQATAFEPAYYYYHRSYAYQLLPQWNGEGGDAARFAQQSADNLGGDAGDILYFQIGEKVVCSCNEPEFGRLSWPRLEKGYELLEKQYGVSMINLNRVALMATKSGDSVAADAAFKRIGDNWDKEAWTTESYFTQNKTWAAQMGPAEVRSRGILQEAAANLQSPGGVQYQKNMEQAMLPFLKQCAQSSNNDQEKFGLVIQVGKDGRPDDVWPRQPTATAQCVLRELYGSHVKKETPFPPPPHPAYWLELQLDPVAVRAAAAN